MKKITLLIALFLCVATGYAQFPAPYCGPITFTNNTEPITLVNFAGINNTSPAALAGPAHQDFTSVTGGAVSGGITYPIILKGNTDGAPFTTYFSVFFDWNHDGDFTDDGETYQGGSVTGSTGVDDIQATANIAVPATALPGTTRMRVVKKFSASAVYPDSCNTGGAGFGQAEDYSIVVTAATCTPPTATFTVASLCPSPTFNVTVAVTALGSATSYAVTDNQNSASQPITAAGTLTFGPYANGTNVTITITDPNNSVCNVSNSTPLSNICLPGCATNPSPANASVDYPYGTLTFSWTAPTDGGAVTEYALYLGDSADDLSLFDTYTETTTGDDLVLTSYGGTIYWQVVAINAAGEAVGCPVWSFQVEDSPGFCLDAYYGQYPGSTYTIPTCNGTTVNPITTIGAAGEYSKVNVTSGQTYLFRSEGTDTSDFITISNEDGTTAIVYGPSPLTWVCNVTGVIRFYSHANADCGTESDSRTRSVVCTPGASAPDYANLQWPPNATIAQGGTFDVYGQVYEPGVTNAAGQGAGILAWVGINTADTNPSTWTITWIPMTYNASSTNADNDEYMAAVGGTLTPGNYFYATRFMLDGGPYVYGGIDASNNGGIWNGTTYGSGELTVNPPAVPANDLCAGAVALTVGGVFADNAVTGTTLGATTVTGLPTYLCQTNRNSDVWYSAVVPASGNLTIEVKASTGNTVLMTDSVISVFTGTCGALVEVACDDDDGDANFSFEPITGLTPGATVYIGVWKWGSSAAGQFQVSAYDASLATGDLTRNGFKFYPNPVTDVLNLSHTSEIKSASVYNILGQEIMNRVINANEAQLNLSTLAKGTYLVKLSAIDGNKTIKIVKE